MEITKAYEEYQAWYNALSPEEQAAFAKKVEDDYKRTKLEYAASEIYWKGYLKKYSPSYLKDKLSDVMQGEHYVYVWKHLNGEPFYVGSGKNDRGEAKWRKNPEFRREISKGDSVIYYLATDISEADARRIEHYVSLKLYFEAFGITNKDLFRNNLKVLFDKCELRKEINTRIAYMLEQQEGTEELNEIIETYRKKYNGRMSDDVIN